MSSSSFGLPEGIEIGKLYPLEFGEGNFATLQYVFKPASVLKQIDGELNLSNKRKVSLTLTGESGTQESFAGTMREDTVSGKDLECVLIKGSDGFKLRKVTHSVLNLRIQREADESKIKESTSKQSMQLLQSKKLPKFLQKQTKKKQSETTLNRDAKDSNTGGPGENPDPRATEPAAQLVDITGTEPVDSVVGLGDT